MQDAYDMADHMAAFGEDSRFVDAPDSETAEDPEFAGIPFFVLAEQLDEYEYEQRQWELYAQEYDDARRY